MFISLEGPEGSGKTVQAKRLVLRLEAAGWEVVAVHEPGGTELADGLREVLLRRAGPPVGVWAEALLFSACRAQLVAEKIRPGLERGAVVVADRFSDSTLAYQGGGRGLPRPQLEALIEISTGGLRPQLTVLLDLPPDVGLRRLQTLGKGGQESWRNLSMFDEIGLRGDWNRFEDEALNFHQRVRDAYVGLAREGPTRWVVVDARAPVEQVAAEIWAAVEPHLPKSAEC